MLRQQVLVDAGAVVEPFGVAGRHQLDQVLVALVGLGEQHQVVRLGLRTALLEPAALGHVDFAAQDRLQPALPRVIVEDHRREHVAVLGHGERRHLQLHRFIEQLVDPAGAVEQRELGVQVKMDELRHYDLSVIGDSLRFSILVRMFGSELDLNESTINVRNQQRIEIEDRESRMHADYSHSIVEGGLDEMS